MCMNVDTHICMCTACMPCSQRPEEGNKYPLPPELGLQTGVSHHVSTGTDPCVLCESNTCSLLLSHLARKLDVWVHTMIR